MKEADKTSLDRQLWYACAGGMVQIPAVNSKVFYFPQGHAEHAVSNVDFGALPRVPPLILCKVAAVEYLADPETDEVYAKIQLVPTGNIDLDCNEEGQVGRNSVTESPEKPCSFAKTLTQSDANNGGGFSVPRYCAETIFPRLDYTVDPPVQTVIAKDVHGELWKFRHIYRGTPRRHLLTTGWSTFVNQKKLVAGDSVVFLSADNGDLCVGIRRAKSGGIGGSESLSGWNIGAGSRSSQCGAFSAFLRQDENKLVMSSGSNGNLNATSKGMRGRGSLIPESVIKAVSLAANGRPFEVVYYPRASTPEFCVKASSVTAAMRVKWCPGMRFKMTFETEDSSRISWFLGTVSAVQVTDPIRWPNSPWRLLQVTWDEPDLLQNVIRVSPWLVELLANVPAIHLSPFSPPIKKLRLLQHPDFPLDDQLQVPSFSGNPLGPTKPLYCISDSVPTGIQGARHTPFGISSIDLHFGSDVQLGIFPANIQHNYHRSKTSDGTIKDLASEKDGVSCMLTVGNSNHELKTNNIKTPRFVLFGQPILTEQQIYEGHLSNTVSQVQSWNSPNTLQKKAENIALDQHNISESASSAKILWRQHFHLAEIGLETAHCKVFLESEDVGHSLDLSVLGSYDELYRILANMFGVERSEMLSHVLYRDATGAVRHAGDEPFSKFMKTAKRLTILRASGANNVGRNWTGLQNAEHGLDSSNQTGPLSIFA